MPVMYRHRAVRERKCCCAGSSPSTQILARHLRVTPTNETASMVTNIGRYCSIRSGTESIVAATEVRTLSTSCAAAADIFSSVASTSDLSIVAQPQNDGMEADDLVVAETLFGSGRPVSVVPYIQKDVLKLGRFTVYWSGSRTAARAVADALPFLIRSKAIAL
jgi:hypothetical protein